MGFVVDNCVGLRVELLSLVEQSGRSLGIKREQGKQFEFADSENALLRTGGKTK